MAFFVAFFIGIFLWEKENKGILIHLKWPLKVWLVGVGGLFGYHFFYFLAMKKAPAIEVNLINYLWPLFIVLFSAFLPQVKLRWFHIAGTFLGLIGVILLITQGKGFHFNHLYLSGYIYAFTCAIIWATYSVLSRFFAKVSTSAVGGFCGVTAILSFVAHFVFEATVIPNLRELLAILALGLGPVGGAFFIWDYGVKNGDIQLLGSFSYAIPLLSTLLLITLGLAKANFIIWISCALIILGSLVSSLHHFKKIRVKQK